MVNHNMDWDEMAIEQQVEYIEDFFHTDSIENIKKKLDNITEVTNLNILEESMTCLKNQWLIKLTRFVIKQYTLNQIHTFKLEDNPVCIVIIGSSVTINIHKKFPEESQDYILHKSMTLSDGSVIKLEGNMLWDYEYTISNGNDYTKSVYLLFYY